MTSEQYSKRFKTIELVLKELGFNKIEHRWYQDGIYTASWESVEEFEEQPTEPSGYNFWIPTIRAYYNIDKDYPNIHKVNDGHFFLLKGELDIDNEWTFELKYVPTGIFQKEREEEFTFFSCSFSNIYEDELPKVKNYIEKLKNLCSK